LGKIINVCSVMRSFMSYILCQSEWWSLCSKQGASDIHVVFCRTLWGPKCFVFLRVTALVTKSLQISNADPTNQLHQAWLAWHNIDPGSVLGLVRYRLVPH
jgi:hypothetical protein